MQLNASSKRRSAVEACVKAGWLTPSQEILPEYLNQVKFLMQKREFANFWHLP